MRDSTENIPQEASPRKEINTGPVETIPSVAMPPPPPRVDDNKSHGPFKLRFLAKHTPSPVDAMPPPPPPPRSLHCDEDKVVIHKPVQRKKCEEDRVRNVIGYKNEDGVYYFKVQWESTGKVAYEPLSSFVDYRNGRVITVTSQIKAYIYKYATEVIPLIQ
jgi:hypothetical protein